jgi:hypothetical protein
MTMSSTSGPLRRPKPEVGAHPRWPELGWLARTGLVTRRVVYGVIAVLGLEVAFRSGGKTASQRGALETSVKRAFTVLGIWGQLARAVVFLIVGYGLVKAATDYSPHGAIGLDGALQTLSRASYGPLLLGIVAAGLLSFALYSITDARYREV